MNRRTILILVLFTAACQSENTQLFLVKGTLLHMDKMTGKYASLAGKDSITLYLDEIPFGKDYNYKRLDSQKVSVKNPKFELRGKTLSNGMFDILIGEDGPMIPIIHDASALEVTIDLSNPDNYYMIKGSAASEQLRMFINDYIKAFMLEYNATYQLDSLKKTGATDSLLIEATNRKNSQIESLNGLLRNQLHKASNPYVALYIAGIMQRRFTTAEYDQLLYDLVVKFPENDELISYKKQYELFQEQQRASEKGSWIGKSAPELILPDTMGKQVALSSFKGKYVLVDFWASWCRPCRLENPNVVAAYEKYRNKNFSVLGVSLDKSKEPWMEAIHSDRLQWTHISDLAFWNSEAVKIFRFDGIPFNVLIDPNGVVIGEGLRGNALQQKLQEVLK